MAEDRTIIDQIKDESLRNAGLGYLIADTSLVVHGLTNRNKDRALTGALWGLGGVGLAAFGKKSSEYQTKELSLNLAAELQSRGISILEDTTLHQRYLHNSKPFYDSTQRFVMNHPTQILSTVYAIGAGFLMRSGLRIRPKNQKRDWWEFSSGALVMAGALAGLFIPENVENPEETKTASVDQNIVEWVKEKPLRASGIFYALNNIPMLYSGYQEQKNGTTRHNSFLLKYLAGASFLSSNLLLGISSKDRRHDIDPKQLETLSSYAAEIVASQPEEVRNKVLGIIAEQMEKEPALKITKEDALAHVQQSIMRSRTPKTVVSNVSEKTLSASLSSAQHAL